jgi:hypothetical protein
MKRRAFLSFGAAAVVMPQAAAAGYEAIPYRWGMGTDLRQSDQTVIWNFRSSWSLTCQIKEELLAGLKTRNPEYRKLTFIDVDFDTYGPSQWVERLKVERRSTLVAMKGGVEIARVENEPYEEPLRRLLDTALNA